MALLILMTPKGETTQIPVAGPDMTIGRAEHNHVVLASMRVSRFHASLRSEGPLVTIHDLDAVAGRTWIPARSAVDVGRDHADAEAPSAGGGT